MLLNIFNNYNVKRNSMSEKLFSFSSTITMKRSSNLISYIYLVLYFLKYNKNMSQLHKKIEHAGNHEKNIRKSDQKV